VEPLLTLLDGNGQTPDQLAHELSDVIEWDYDQKTDFYVGMTEKRGAAAELCRNVGRYSTFSELWAIAAKKCVKAFASRAGFSERCELPEFIKGLLERPFIRASAAAYLALWYTREFPIAGPAPEYAPSDSRDMHHMSSVAAAAAAIFVTQERRLPRLMELVKPIALPLIRVTDLSGLLSEICQAKTQE